MNTARHSTARIFSANPFGFSHGQRTVREVSRGTDQPAPSIQPNSTWRRSSRAIFRQLRAQVLCLVAGTILIALLAVATRAAGLVLVTTDSSCPIGIYRTVHKPLMRGQLVDACLPDAIASYGLARGYLNSGDCPNGAEPVIKVVGAMAGDHVDLSLEDIRVNGTTLPQSATRLRDSRGREVRTLRPGGYETEADQVWLFGTHDPRSWDSRYFGPISLQNVIGAVDPVFTLARFARTK